LEHLRKSRCAYTDLVRKPEGMRSLGKPSVDGKIILKWIFRNLDVGMDWIELSQDRDRWQAVVYTIMNIWVPDYVWNFLTSLETVSLSRRTLLNGLSK